MFSRQEYIERAMQAGIFPTLDTSCAHCNGKIRYANHVNCSCGLCTYCSLQCAENDEDRHSSRCRKIVQLSADIETRTADLRRFHPDDEIALFDSTGVDSSLWVDEEELRPILAQCFQNERTALLGKRNDLVKELMHEGSTSSGRCAAEYTSGNLLAYDMACRQSIDLLLLQKTPSAAELVLQVHLLTGRFEKLYDICCHYMTRGTDVTTREGLDMIGQERMRKMNITKCYTDSRWEEHTLFGDDKGTNLLSLVHIFLVKYMIYMSMENLHHINTNFLDNKDCINLIGEFVGLKKEWIITDDINWYRNQAYKVARMIHCCNMYGYEGHESRVNECFDKIKEGAQEYFYNNGRTSVNEAIETGKNMVYSFRLQQRINSMPNLWLCSLVKKLKASYEADLAIVYKFEVKSLLMAAVQRINILAGWNAVGSGNYRPKYGNHSHLCITEFVTDALKTCRGSGLYDIFHSPYLSETDIFYDDTERLDYEDLEELFEEYDMGNFDEALLICISLEQKIAYCNFHQNKGNDDVVNILAQLPGENSVYTSEPLPDSEDFAVRVSFESGVNMESITMANEKLVSALFKQGLATKDNLDILFGRSGYSSYQIWKLQKQKEERRQPSIWSFITNSRLWKEGCTDIDRRSGLKIKYLNRQDRSQKFRSLMQELTKLVPIGSILESVVPSVEQFVSKFGWNCLNDTATKQLLMEWISSYEVRTDKCLNMEDNSNPKRRRCDIDSFLTAEDACRHYFNTRSLEEAVWDAAGVPRIIILNGNRERMQKAGWKSIKGGIQGDEGLRLGSRIAHVYSPSCLVYEEQVKPAYNNRPEIFGFDEFKFRLDFTC